MTREELNELGKEELMDIIEDLHYQLELRKKSNGRKEEVLAILKEFGPINISSIAKKLDITAKNVSSQLTYLRNDGHPICTDNHGKKFIM